MARAKQERLVRIIERGGRLLIAPILPALDERLETCTLLADYLGLAPLTPAGEALCRPGFGGLKNVLGRAS